MFKRSLLSRKKLKNLEDFNQYEDFGIVQIDRVPIGHALSDGLYQRWPRNGVVVAHAQFYLVL